MRKYILLIGDVLILYLSLLLTLLIRYQEKFDLILFQRHLLPFSIVFLILLVTFYIDEMYDLTIGKGLAELFNRLIRSLMIGGGIGIIFFYIASGRLFTIRPQRVFLIYLLIAAILIYFWRIGFNRLVRSPKISRNVAIIGFNALTQEITEELITKPEFGLQTKIIIPTNHEERVLIPKHLQPLISETPIEQLKNICQDKNIEIIASTIHPRENPTLLKSLIDCLPLKITFFDITNLYEKITGKIPVNKIEQIWFLENLSENNKKLYDRIKRLIDLIASLSLLIISLPFFPLITLVIKLDSAGQTFFTQQRTGKEGDPFTAVKFRTMVKNAEDNGPQWAVKNDGRVTRVGRFLRKTRIDEIPQLFNVLKGEMSLIGPRPERPEFVEQLQKEIPFYKERILIKPGLTGWAQVAGPAYGGSTEESLEKLQYDLFYIKNRSFGLDLSIALKTIKTILSRKGQ